MGDDAQPEPGDFVASAHRIKELVAEIERQITLKFDSLDGTVESSLGAARADLEAAIDLPAAKDQALRQIIVDASMRSHASEGLAKAGSEPELLHEWVGVGATSAAVVRATSWLGRVSGRVAILALFLGIVGVGAQAISPTLMQKVLALELTLAGEIADQDLKAAVQQRPAPPQPEPDMASDDETIRQLRSAYRSSFARSLQRPGGVQLSARQTHELAALKARQDILAVSARPAAPPLQSGVPTEVIHPRLPEPPPAARAIESALDDALDRRIATLRAEEGLWYQLRASATRPAPADLVADQFLRAAFAGDNPFADSIAMRRWVEHSSADFAAAAARTGEIPQNHRFAVNMATMMQGLSARDRRLLADFEGDAPQKVASVLDDIRGGHQDPGSLHRSPLTPRNPGVGPGGGGMANAYAELFPSVIEDVASGPAAGGGGGGGGDVNRARANDGTVRPAASRSYARIRFSPRVGGVVIGRMPEQGAETLDVTGFDWQLRSDGRLVVSLTSSDGATVSLGHFHAAIAHHALAYAADGRVVVSTLPQPTSESQDPVPARAVVVHPAFEDTAFACSAIQVDRFVDTFLEAERSAAVGDARLAVRILGFIIKGEPEVIEELPVALGLIAAYAKACGIGEKCFPIDFYKRCGIDFGSTGQLLHCLAASSSPADCESFVSNLNAKAGILVDSGVRESPYTLDNRFKFLSATAHRDDPLWPMDFTIQAVPVDLTEQSDSPAQECDVWEFQQHRQAIRDAVVQGIAQEPDAMRILAAMREFIVLQRLFRLALEGELGRKFPLNELLEMQQATKRFVKVQRHERWNYNEQLVRYIYSYQRAIGDVLKLIGNDTRNSAECKAAARTQLAALKELEWPSGVSFWPTIAETAEKCRAEPNGYELANATDRLRRAGLIEEAIYMVQRGADSSVFACEPL